MNPSKYFKKDCSDWLLERLVINLIGSVKKS